MDCNDIQKAVSQFSLVGPCDRIVNGMLRFSTPFQYPDGSNIDLFIGPNGDLWSSLKLTDLGQTTANLLDLHIKPWATKKRKQVVADICQSLGVARSGAEFQIILNNVAELPSAIVRLSQACIRASDLMFTQRWASPAVFKDDLEEFIVGIDLPYKPDISIPGRFGRDVPLDFAVKGAHVESLILGASTQSAAAAHPMTNEMLRKWLDLENVRSQYQFLSVYDSNSNAFRDDDLRRLETVSTVFAYPAQGGDLQAAIAA